MDIKTIFLSLIIINNAYCADYGLDKWVNEHNLDEFPDVYEYVKSNSDLLKNENLPENEVLERVDRIKGSILTNALPTLLNEACQQGDLKSVKLLINTKLLSVNDGIVMSCSKPIHYAVKLGHYDVVKFLIDSGADINCIGDNKCNILISAIKLRKNNILFSPINEEVTCSKLNLELDYIKMAKESAKDYENLSLSLIKLLLENKIDTQLIYKNKTAFKTVVNDNFLDALQMMIFYKVPWEGCDNEHDWDIRKKVSCDNNRALEFESIKDFQQSLRKMSTVLQLYLLDHTKAYESKIIQNYDLFIIYGSAAIDLFKAVKEGSKVKGNMYIVHKLKEFISLDLVDENNHTVFDIAIKNQDKLMLITLLSQGQDSLNTILRKNWNNESSIDRLIKSIKKQPGNVLILSLLLSILHLQ